MKNIFRLLACLFVLPAATGPVARAEDTNLLDGVAAVVEEGQILRSDVNRAAGQIYRQLMTRYEGPELEEKLKAAYDEVLNTLVEHQVILAAYPNADQKTLDSHVDDQIEQIVRVQFNGDRAAFLAALAEQKMPLEMWRREKKQQALVSSIVREEISRKVVVSPSAVAERYEAEKSKYRSPPAIKLRMIVIGAGQDDGEKARKRKLADEIRAKAAGGEDFSGLAEKFSEVAAESGGDCGWQEYKDIKGDLLKDVTNLAVNAVSEVLGAGGSYYILKVEDTRPEQVAPLEKVRPEIEQQLMVEEFSRLYDAWIARLKKRVYVKII